MTAKKVNKTAEAHSKDWVTYRPEIKVLDCTVRDGGLMNDHRFDDGFVKNVYDALVAAGVDYMELGYKASKKLFAPTDYGPWKFCDEDDIRRIVGENDTDLKLTAMADAERTDYHTDILPCEDSVLDVIRVATYVHQIPTAIDMLKDAHDKGYETTINLMAVSAVQERELDVAIDTLADTPVGTIYLLDSWGAFYSEQIQSLMAKYVAVAEPRGKQVGIHAHNNQNLAYANTITAIIEGANRLDATIDGMGRGAGNCPMELLLGFLHNPKFRVRPILKCLQEDVLPLKECMNWGCQVPYMLTGLLNQHPRAAMKFLASDDRKNFLAFYDDIIQEE